MSGGPLTVAVNGSFAGQQVTGVQRYAWEMLRALGRVGRERLRLVLISPARPGPEGAVLEGVELLVDETRLPRALWIQLRLPLLFERSGARLLWSPANVGPLRVSRQLVTFHDAAVFEEAGWFSASFRLYYRTLLPRLGRRADRVIAPSEFAARELARHGVAPAEKIDVVPGGVSSAFRPEADRSRWAPWRPYVLALGSRDPRKNIRGLLRAWDLLPPAARAGRRLLIAGGTGRPFARERLPEPAGDVVFLDYIAEADLPGLYAGADLFVHPSLYEGFGLPPLEAMASGVPVLVSRSASLPEVCGDAAIYFDPEDPCDIAAGMGRVLADAGLLTRLRSAGLERARRFTWEDSARKLAGILEALAAR